MTDRYFPPSIAEMDMPRQIQMMHEYNRAFDRMMAEADKATAPTFKIGVMPFAIKTATEIKAMQRMECQRMTRPVRIQRQRTKGYNMQAESLALNGLPAVSVCRPGKWGNPHPVGKPCPMCDGEIHTRQEAVDCYEADVKHACAITLAQAQAELRGKNLACFCSLEDVCHGDVLLRIANVKDEVPK